MEPGRQTDVCNFPDPGRVETKGALVEALACARSNFLIGYHFWAVPVHGPKRFRESLPSTRTWPQIVKEYNDLAELMDWRRDVELQFWENYRRGLGRALIKESFELALHYCRISHQMSRLHAWSTFRFFRLLRNAMSHTTGARIRWTYGPDPIEWRGYRYTPESDGQDVALTDEEALDLQAELQAFVERSLE